MLFKREQFQGLRDGSITLSFRLWKRPQARVGARYRFGTDEWVRISKIQEVSLARVSNADAQRAGHAGRKALADTLDRLSRGDSSNATLYRISLEYAGRAKPTVPERGAKLSKEEWRVLAVKLDAMDARRGDAWTHEMLCTIRDQPGCAAAELSSQLGRAKAPFKQDVRKLKALGLTISLEVGYKLSPKGKKLLTLRA